LITFFKRETTGLTNYQDGGRAVLLEVE